MKIKLNVRVNLTSSGQLFTVWPQFHTFLPGLEFYTGHGSSTSEAVEDLFAKLPEDFTIEEIEHTGYVWENTPIKLHAYCYKAPYIMPPYPNRTTEPCGEYQPVTHKLPLTLEPFGCTNLRLTYFPKALTSSFTEKKK